MEQKDKNVCAHPACTCATREGSKYCSQYCEDAKDTEELACNCGHAGCGVDAMSGTPVRDMSLA